MMRDVMLPNHDFDVDAKIVRAAEDLNHAANRLIAVFGELDNLNVDHHAIEIFGRVHLDWSHSDAIAIQRGRRDFHAFRNQDPLTNSLVMRRYKVSALANAKLAHDGLVRAAKDLDDCADSRGM